MQILIARSNRSNSGTIKCLQECLCAPGILVHVIAHCGLTEFMQFAMSRVNYEKYAVIFVDAELALSSQRDWTSELRTPRATHNLPPLVGVVDRDQPAHTKSCIDIGVADLVSEPFCADAMYECICTLPTYQAPSNPDELETICTKANRLSCSSADELTDFHDGLVLSLAPKFNQTVFDIANLHKVTEKQILPDIWTLAMNY